MSKKYSTEEVISELMRHWVGIGDCFNKRDAIVARLRAADKLCAAANKFGSRYTGDPVLTRFERIALLDKAIADYEGGK